MLPFYVYNISPTYCVDPGSRTSLIWPTIQFVRENWLVTRLKRPFSVVSKKVSVLKYYIHTDIIRRLYHVGQPWQGPSNGSSFFWHSWQGSNGKKGARMLVIMSNCWTIKWSTIAELSSGIFIHLPWQSCFEVAAHIHGLLLKSGLWNVLSIPYTLKSIRKAGMWGH